MDVKPGIFTTEFYFTLISNVMGIVTLFAPNVHFSDQLVHTIAGIAVIVVTNAVYIFSRGKIKAAAASPAPVA